MITEILLPDRTVLHAFLACKPIHRFRGLSFGAPLDDSQGLLLVFPMSGLYPIHMNFMRFPIDALWLNDRFEVVECIASIPPSPSGGSPSYGGFVTSRYILEIAAGGAALHHICVGSTLRPGERGTQLFYAE
jgi:uncharacterized protein